MQSLELKNIYKSYGHSSGSVDVLKGLDASFAETETVAILGPSGSGKSTLLSIMAGLDRPDKGEVAIGGKSLGPLSEQELTRYRAQSLGIVFQQFHLLNHYTALENVLLPLDITRPELGRKEKLDLAQKALTEVGLDHRINHFPHELSGGECQRVAIARAFVATPAVILADEPSGNLDESTGEKVMKALFGMIKTHGCTLVLVTHNKELARWCNKVFELHNGTLTEITKKA